MLYIGAIQKEQDINTSRQKIASDFYIFCTKGIRHMKEDGLCNYKVVKLIFIANEGGIKKVKDC